MDFGLQERKDHSPLYYQIAESLRTQIFRGELAPMSRLPAEKALCALFHASRITIRSALRKLETEGLVHRVNGKGTFVAELAEKQRQMILVVEKSPADERHLHELIMGALVSAQGAGFRVLISTRAQLRGFLEEAVSSPSRQTGVLLLRCRELCMDDILFAEKHGIPCLLEGCERVKGCNWLAIDNDDAMRQVVDHLYSLGRRRFGIFHAETPYRWSSFQERYAATCRRLAEHGIAQDDICTVTLPVDADMGCRPYTQTAEFFAAGHPLDAIICVNDLIAIQVVKWLLDHGYRVPDDIAVTGFDDILPAEYISPSLTTIRQDYYALGGDAVQQLHGLMDDFDNKRVQISRKLSLIIRKSTGKRQTMEPQNI